MTEIKPCFLIENMNLITVEQATEIIFNQSIDFGIEEVDIVKSLGRVLAEDLKADRDFPPFDRVTMDGIAINFEAFLHGTKNFKIEGLQAAGDVQMQLSEKMACLEVMTGACLPKNADTVIRYEDLEILENQAKVLVEIKKGQNVHNRGTDCEDGAIIVKSGKKINAGDLAIAATIGKSKVLVKKLPKVALVSSGDELISINEVPLPHQIRGSNVFAIQGLLSTLGIVADHEHCSDNLEKTVDTIQKAVENYQVVILSGGVSMGKKDFIPEALAKSGVKQLFHKISQKPGKPMWFGRRDNTLVFALPGNPVSTFMCTLRYVLPWIQHCLGSKIVVSKAILAEEVCFKSTLSYFLQVKLKNEDGTLMAYPLSHQGSGDFINLSEANGFIELPQRAAEIYHLGEVFTIYTF
jgi:molybdopterin molybdotransferase